ncbi:IS110 family transposase [Paenibacillus sp. MSJ-34]|uniref:IS110 family transposase n=3 Tax=unclassified Paenibacillus TaxID=185978 RepID=UPI001C11ECAA|nr:IS110 family transposase [Paenibacillus sp. MSJ-34]MBU5445694.1 IS110 family transposase [Paenibacillus sp. MSJ-34]
MDAILERCAGLDIHQDNVVACFLYGSLDKKPSKEIETFGTTTDELIRLLDWLQDRECVHVAMESTGVYWKPVWNILEGTCELTLANPERIKNIPGKKTDYNDAEWIARLHRHGLIQPSFVPPEDIRDLRDLTRYRRKLVQNVTQEKNRIHKILQDANLKLATFITDIFGVSGRALLESIVNGEVLDEHQIRNMVKTQLKRKVPELIQALNGRLRVHHRRMIKRHLDHIAFLEQEIKELEDEIDQLIAPYRLELELLDTIPGISLDAAASILAEVGPDMSHFPSDAHLTSWAGVCPANHESNGKKKRKKNYRGNKGLKTLLIQCGWSAIKVKDSRIPAVYFRLVKRMGKQKAIMAVAHLLLRIIYVVLRDKVPYQELGADYLGSRERNIDYWVRKIQQMGYEVELREIVPA